MSPRRSSRARSSQQPPPAPNHTSSYTSTVTKPERESRTAHRANSPRRSSTQPSESIDGADPTSRAGQIPPRRSRRNGDEKEANVKVQPNEEDNDVEAADEEVTRCLCGQAEYPGPSPALRQQQPTADSITDETGNFFVQCDNCGVWQHGGCMGLLDESLLPDEYYCEQCKPDFHRITKSANGHRSSQYNPIVETASTRSSPLSSNPETGRKKDSKSSQSEITKRRATMNSRGAYDEDEMLRRAIEESKEMGSLGKRTREESEDHKGHSKRLRTGSNTSETFSKHSGSPEPAAIDEATQAVRTASQKLRGAAARNNKEKEMRDQQKEQQAAQRAEAASKRKARSERRRVEDSPPPTPSLSPSKAAQANGKAKAETPPASRSNTTTSRKPGGRPPMRRGRLGRNQYTRDQNNGEDENTPFRDGSHDRNGGEKSGAGSPAAATGTDAKDSSNHSKSTTTYGHSHTINGESGRSSKARTHPARTSLNEMKRRVAAILEFVGRMQTERTTQQPAAQNASGNSTHSNASSGTSKGSNTPNGNGLHKGSNGFSSSLGSSVANASSLPTASLVRAVEASLKDASDRIGDGGGGGNDGERLLKVMDERGFGTMGSVDMMETLTKELVQWQSVYGVYSR